MLRNPGAQRSRREVLMANVTNNRPLSPHLQIYKPTPTMVMSIVHRITGGALYVGTVLVAWWLIAAASGQGSYDWANWVLGSLLGKLVLLGYTWALLHHMLGGFRHFMWDLGYGFDKHFSTRIAKIQFIASPILTLVVWIIGYMAR